jgi:hypothetical protein
MAMSRSRHPFHGPLMLPLPGYIRIVKSIASRRCAVQSRTYCRNEARTSSSSIPMHATTGIQNGLPIAYVSHNGPLKPAKSAQSLQGEFPGADASSCCSI